MWYLWYCLCCSKQCKASPLCWDKLCSETLEHHRHVFTPSHTPLSHFFLELNTQIPGGPFRRHYNTFDLFWDTQWIKLSLFRSKMFSVLGDVKGLIKLDKLCIDNNVFRLHYKVHGCERRDFSKVCNQIQLGLQATFIILLTASILVTAKQYMG